MADGTPSFDPDALALAVFAVEARERALAVLGLVFRVMDDHESGEWSGDRVFCRRCGAPTEYPCTYRRWAEECEQRVPPSLMQAWRERMA